PGTGLARAAFVGQSAALSFVRMNRKRSEGESQRRFRQNASANEPARVGLVWISQIRNMPRPLPDSATNSGTWAYLNDGHKWPRLVGLLGHARATRRVAVCDFVCSPFFSDGNNT